MSTPSKHCRRQRDGSRQPLKQRDAKSAIPSLPVPAALPPEALRGLIAFGLDPTEATIVLARKDEHAILNFHKFSLVVWLIWLVPYFSGFFLSMG